MRPLARSRRLAPVLLLLAAVCGGEEQGAGDPAQLSDAAKRDRAPRISAVVYPREPVPTGAAVTLAVMASDPDRDPLSYAWTASCAGTFSAPSAATTVFTPDAPGKCTIAIVVTANALQDAVVFDLNVVDPTGTANVHGTFVPQPVVTEVVLDGWIVPRSAADATIRATLVAGVPVAGAFSFDLGTVPVALEVSVRDDCGGAASAVDTWEAEGGLGGGTFVWTPPGASAVCLVTVALVHETLADAFGVAVLVGP